MNKKLFISFPNKTFLIGEYAVLNSAPAVLVNTTPLFEFALVPKTEQSQKWIQNHEGLFKKKSLVISSDNKETSFIKAGKDADSFYKNIHPASPAGQWLKLYPQIQNHWHIELYDPHKGQGGFGLSSAQFNLMYWLSQINLENTKLKDIKPYDLWKSYKELSFDGHTPSGADVISQWIGKLCLFTAEPFKVKTTDWPFDDLDFLILQTGVQLNTWEHLKNISIENLKTSELSNLSRQAADCLNNQDTNGFVSAVENYGVCLEKQNLVHENTLDLLKKIKVFKNILAAKGCGAMGAEVVVLFFHPQDKEQIKSDLKNICKNNSIAADSSSITAGRQMSV